MDQYKGNEVHEKYKRYKGYTKNFSLWLKKTADERGFTQHGNSADSNPKECVLTLHHIIPMVDMITSTAIEKVAPRSIV